MAATLHDFASAVTNAIAISRDAEQGFRGAADAVKDPALKEMFERISAQRSRFATELQQAVKSMGFDPTNPSGVAGVVHGAWMAVKGLVTGHSDHAILSETERGEDLSLKTYREALACSLPENLRNLMGTQYQSILQTHDRIRTLRDATAPKDTETPVSTR